VRCHATSDWPADLLVPSRHMFRKRRLVTGTGRQDYTRGTTHCRTRPNLAGTVSKGSYTIYGNQRFVCNVARPFLVHFFIKFSCLYTVYSVLWCCLENLLVYFSFFLCLLPATFGRTSIFTHTLFTIKWPVHSEEKTIQNPLQTTLLKLVRLVSYRSDFAALRRTTLHLVVFGRIQFGID
jgi:hypothetical protein